ncbi:26939_t:CDS:2, partial [Dentiscutata erythropus]
YFKYQGRFGLGMTEDKPQSLSILLANVNPKNYKVKNNKNYYFFLLSTQPALKTSMKISLTISKKKFIGISEELPQSPAPQIIPKILFFNFSSQPNPNLKITPYSQHTHYCMI